MKKVRSGFTLCLNIRGIAYKWWENLRIRKSSGQQEICYDSYQLSFRQWMLYTAQGAAACGLVTYVFYRSYLAFWLLLPLFLCYPLVMKQTLKDKRREQLEFQFKESISVLASALHAGYAVENALKVAGSEMIQLYGEDSMIAREYATLIHQVSMNRPVEAVFMEFSERSGLEDIQSFAEVFAVAKRSGGELVSIIQHVTTVIRDKLQVKEEILTLTAEKRYEQKIMNMVPFGIVLYIDITSPGFFDPMYQTWIGKVVMTVCLAVYGLAYWLSGRLMRIEV